MRERRS